MIDKLPATSEAFQPPMPDERPVQLALSNLNLPPQEVALHGMKYLREFLDEVEVGVHPTDGQHVFPAGYDLTPTRSLIVSSYLGNLNPGDASGVHQSWPTPPTRRFFSERANGTWQVGVANAKFWLGMPEAYKSLETIRRMGEQAEARTATIYANQRTRKGELVDFKGLAASGMVVATQVEPESMEELGGVENYQNFHNSLVARGISGVIIGSHHIQRAANIGSHHQGPSGITPGRHLDPLATLRSIEHAGTPITGFHVEVGRQDARDPEDTERSYREFTALLKGPDRFAATDSGRILAESFAIHQRQWRDMAKATKLERTQSLLKVAVPIAVLEVPMAAHARRHEEAFRPAPNRADLVSVTRDMGQSVNEFFVNVAAAL